ncbi:hypothetical protein [Curtobacterium sp. SL109]|uniref:hypothetical protein n=1 Tax=Curtobacterium sp. SL109 TaxID=2994662 RepID=UPI0022722DDB|nr:hypothetical protein [Curtobacterium sp. SL109]MCY1695326.1 hypothetical protein [Curtobacterium sp. SL109]
MSPGDAHLAADRERRVALTARLEAFETDYALGNITGGQLRKFTERVEGELAHVDARLAQGISRSASSVLRAADPGAAFLEATLDVQKCRAIAARRSGPAGVRCTVFQDRVARADREGWYENDCVRAVIDWVRSVVVLGFEVRGQSSQAPW